MRAWIDTYELSDILGEIPDIEEILYILEQEKISGLTGFYQYSNKLSELIIHLRKIRSIVRKESLGEKLSDEDLNYLTDNNLTDIAKEMIRINL